MIIAILVCGVGLALADGDSVLEEAGAVGQIILQVPYGMKNSDTAQSTGLAVRDSVISALATVESYHQTPLDVDFTVELPAAFSLAGQVEGAEVHEIQGKVVVHARFRLVTEFDDWHRLFKLTIPTDAAPGHYTIKARARLIDAGPDQTPRGVIRQAAEIRVASQEQVQRLLTVSSIRIPADLKGQVDDKNEQNCLVLRSGLGVLGKLIGAGEDDDIRPASFVAIGLVNGADEDAAVLVDWQVLDAATGKEAEGFRISRDFLEFHGGGDDRIYARVQIPAKGQADVTLPVFADRGKVLAGHYLGRVSMNLFGSNTRVVSREFDLNVRKMSWSSIATTLYAMGVALVMGIFLVAGHPKLLGRFKTRWLILIALFGSAKFLVALVPRIFLNEVFNGLLGPFSAFATGLIREGITSLFVMSLVVLVPLPGVVTLSMLMSMILTCLMGSLSPVFILFMVVAMSTTEIALYLTGFTRGSSPGFTATKKALVLAAIGMGAASAFAMFVDYHLYMLLYRLYYADWFIGANIVIVGFLYSAIFAPAGVILGNKLQKVAME
ncbi:hypothetical protein [Desulfosarcina variabilis]|uniref:hypothetical protein n=1 Tax=Desulfosarcina variabilis TaxID=2300 RepID=UPI003AFAEB35